MKPPLAQHRLDDDRGDAVRRDARLEDLGERAKGALRGPAFQFVRERCLIDFAAEWAEMLFVRRVLSRHRQREQRSPVVACANVRIAGRPVYSRAIFTAFSTASAPVVTSSVFFGESPGASAFRRSASSRYGSYIVTWKHACV